MQKKSISKKAIPVLLIRISLSLFVPKSVLTSKYTYGNVTDKFKGRKKQSNYGFEVNWWVPQVIRQFKV